MIFLVCGLALITPPMQLYDLYKTGRRPKLPNGVTHQGRAQAHPPIPAAEASAAGPFTGPITRKDDSTLASFRETRDERLLVLGRDAVSRGSGARGVTLNL